MTKRTTAAKKTPAIRIGTHPSAPTPWTMYPWGDPEDTWRDLWCVKTSHELVIGPIYGKANALLVCAAPDLYAAASNFVSVMDDGREIKDVSLRAAVRKADGLS